MFRLCYVDKIMIIIEVDRHLVVTEEQKMNHKNVLNHLHKAGSKKKIDVWMPHKLTQEKYYDGPKSCLQSLGQTKRNQTIFTTYGDWGWEIGNIQKYCAKTIMVKRQKSCPKDVGKVLLRVWRGWKGIIIHMAKRTKSWHLLLTV